MNRQRRSKLRKVLKSVELITAELESIREEEENARWSLPDNLQDSDRSMEMDTNIEYIDNAINAMSDVVGEIESID